MVKKLVPKMAIVLILGVSLCLPSFALAFHGKHPGRPGFPGHPGSGTCPFKTFIVSFLGLTDDQLEEIGDLHSETYEKIKPLIEEIKGLGIKETLLAEEINIDNATAKLGEMVEIKSQILSIVADTHLGTVLILTSEQRQRVGKHLSNIINLLKYIAEYPDWDKIKKDFEEDILPILEKLRPDRPGHSDPLDLTDEQKEEIGDLHSAAYDEVKPLKEEIKGLGLLETLMAEEIDVDNATAKLEEMVDLESRISAIAADAALGTVQILNPEQRQTILEMSESKSSCPYMGR